MHVDEGVETAFETAEQPVDGPFFVALHMVVVEVLEEIVADTLANGCLDKI